jgi:D-3-phosphoglycerate dehydrogenase/C-terminal binding protein
VTRHSENEPWDEEGAAFAEGVALATVKPGVVLVNTARGATVELDALYAALNCGQVGGAVLDVLPHEPFDQAHPLIADWLAHEPWIEGRLALSSHAAFFSPASMVDVQLNGGGGCVGLPSRGTTDE